jgi:hypothetical protein
LSYTFFAWYYYQEQLVRTDQDFTSAETASSIVEHR